MLMDRTLSVLYGRRISRTEVGISLCIMSGTCHSASVVDENRCRVGFRIVISVMGRSTGVLVLGLQQSPLIWSPQAGDSMGGGCQLFAILVGPGPRSLDSHGWNAQSPPLIGPRGMLGPHCGSGVSRGGGRWIGRSWLGPEFGYEGSGHMIYLIG